MKTQNLLNFQYGNAATSLYVNVNEFSDMMHREGSLFVLTIIENNNLTRSNPETRADAFKDGEAAIAHFLKNIMVPVYLGNA